MRTTVYFDKQMISGWLIVSAFAGHAAAQQVERPAGQVEVIHATGLLRLDPVVEDREVVLGGQPFAIATIDLDGDGMGDRNHDLVVATQNGIYVLEARPLAGDLSIRGINAFLATDAPSAPTGGRIAAFDTRPIGTPPVDVAPDVLALYTGIPEVRFFTGALGFAGSGGGPVPGPFLDAEGDAGFVDPAVLAGAVDMDVGRFGPDRLTVAGIAGPLGSVLLIRGGSSPNVPGIPLFAGTITLDGEVVAIAHLPGATPRFAVLGVFDLTGFQPQPAVLILELSLTGVFGEIEVIDTFVVGGTEANFVPLDIARASSRSPGAFELLILAAVPAPSGAVSCDEHIDCGAGGLCGIGDICALPGTAGVASRIRRLDFQTGEVTTVVDAPFVTPNLMVVDDLGGGGGRPADLLDDVVLIGRVGRNATVAVPLVARDNTFIPGPALTLGDELFTFPIDPVDGVIGHFNSDDVLDVALVDQANEQVIFLRGTPPPVATYIEVAIHGHQGLASAFGELTNPFSGGFVPERASIDPFGKVVFTDLLDDINNERRQVSEEPPVAAIAVNGHWETLTSLGAANQITGRSLWVGSALLPSPACFELTAAALNALGENQFADFFSPPSVEARPPDYWFRTLFFTAVPAAFGVTTLLPLVCTTLPPGPPGIPFPDPAQQAKTALMAGGVFFEVVGAWRGNHGSTLAAANMAVALERAVELARQDMDPCTGQVFVDVMGHSRGGAVAMEMLQLVNNRDLIFNAEVNLILLDAVDPSFAFEPATAAQFPSWVVDCPFFGSPGDSCRPWAKAGFVAGDPQLGFPGRVTISSINAERAWLGDLLSFVVPAVTTAVLPEFVANDVATYSVALPIGYNRELALAAAPPAQVQSPLLDSFKTVGVEATADHAGIESYLTADSIRSTTNNAFVDPMSGSPDANTFTYPNTTRLGALFLDPKMPDSIVDGDGWVRSELVPAESLRMPEACTGAPPVLDTSGISSVASSIQGGHRVREFAFDADFNLSRGYGRNAQVLVLDKALLAESLPAEIFGSMEVVIDDAAAGHFSSIGFWQVSSDDPNCELPGASMNQTASLNAAFAEPMYDDPLSVLSAIEAEINTLLASGLPRKQERAMEKAAKKLERALHELEEERQDKTLKALTKVVRALEKARQKGADVGTLPTDIVMLGLSMLDRTRLRASSLMGPEDRQIVRADESLQKGLAFLEEGKPRRAIKNAAKGLGRLHKKIEFNGDFCLATGGDGSAELLHASTCVIADALVLSLALAETPSFNELLHSATSDLEAAAISLALGQPLRAEQRLISAEENFANSGVGQGLILELIATVITALSTGEAPFRGPCVLVLGEEEQPFNEAISQRLVVPLVGALPDLSFIGENPSPSEIDDAALILGDTANALQEAMPDAESETAAFADMIQYAGRLASGGSQIGEAYVRYFDPLATITQELHLASTQQPSLFVDIEYRFNGDEGSLEVAILGAELGETHLVTAAAIGLGTRARVSFTAVRTGEGNLRTPDVISLTGARVDVLSVSVRSQAPRVVAGRLYDLVLVEGGVDWDQATAVAQRTMRNGQRGTLASIHDEETLDAIFDAFAIESPVWLGARGVATGPGGFTWTDGTPFDFQPWADDVTFDPTEVRPAYVLADVAGEKRIFRHAPQKTTLGGRPLAFLIDFGPASNGSNLSPNDGAQGLAPPPQLGAPSTPEIGSGCAASNSSGHSLLSLFAFALVFLSQLGRRQEGKSPAVTK